MNQQQELQIAEEILKNLPDGCLFTLLEAVLERWPELTVAELLDGVAAYEMAVANVRRRNQLKLVRGGKK